MKGFSLIELIIAIAIISFLSTIGVNTFINFKNETSIDNLAYELISDIKLARNKSMNGELLKDETEENFIPNNLPRYGLKMKKDTYQIVRQCSKTDGTTCDTENLENLEYTDDFKIRSISSLYILDPEIDFFFERITGKSDPITITLKEKSAKYGRKIEISSDFIIKISKI